MIPVSWFELYATLPAFLLVLARVSGLVLATPLFSGVVIPTRVKIWFSVAMALSVFPLTMSHIPARLTVGSAVLGLIGELALGVFIGLGVTVILLGVQLATELIGQQSGMRLGSVFNPMMESAGTQVSQLYFLVAMMVFLAVGGDRALVRALLDSFATVPLLGFRVSANVVGLVVDMLTLSLTIAIRVGGPTVLALLLSFLTLGFISRTMPQLNILTVGFPLKLAVALVVMAMALMSMEPVLLEAVSLCMNGIRVGLGLDPAI